MTKAKTIRKYKRRGPERERQVPRDDEFAWLDEVLDATKRGKQIPMHPSRIRRRAEQLRESRTGSTGPVGCHVPPDPYEIPTVGLCSFSHHAAAPASERFAIDDRSEDE